MKAFKKVIEKRNLFKEYVKIINGLLQLSGKESEVFAELLQANHDNPKETDILSKDIRKRIMGELNMKKTNLSKYISVLKSKGVISKDESGHYINNLFVPDVAGNISETVFILDVK